VLSIPFILSAFIEHRQPSVGLSEPDTMSSSFEPTPQESVLTERNHLDEEKGNLDRETMAA